MRADELPRLEAAEVWVHGAYSDLDVVLFASAGSSSMHATAVYDIAWI